MNTLCHAAPPISRVKALIAVLLAAVALAGTVEVVAPDLASAQKRIDVAYCEALVMEAEYWEEVGLGEEVDRVWDEYLNKCTYGMPTEG